MNFLKIALPLAALAVAPSIARACDCATSAQKLTVATADPGHAKAGVRTIQIAVTKDGFTPGKVSAKAGETVKLEVTRKVERTCATEIVMKDFKVNEKLPLEKTVTVTVKPAKPGEYRFACGMDMVAGTLVVE
jgi:plastocyanin domain-containing protein